MTTQPDAAQKSRLANLRIFLLICCSGVSVGCTLLAVAPVMLLNPSGDNVTVSILGVPLSNLSPSFPALVFLTFSIMTGCASVVCLAVYFVVRSRLEKEGALGLAGDIDETPD